METTQYENKLESETVSNKKVRVMLGITGETFSSVFMMNWTVCLTKIIQHNEFDVSLFPGYSAFSPYMRLKTLGIDNMSVKTKPFQGKDYDVFVSIDSSIIFTYEQFKHLVEKTVTYPAVTGYYMFNETQIQAITSLYPEDHDGVHKLVLASDVTERKSDPFFVEYTGLGFFACRKEVLDTIEFPYVWYPLVEYIKDTKLCKEIVNDEMAFCLRLRDKRFKIFLDHELLMKQEKKILF